MQYTAIQEQFNSVIEYSQGYSGVNTDELFEKWLDAKRDFIEAENLFMSILKPFTLNWVQKKKA